MWGNEREQKKSKVMRAKDKIPKPIPGMHTQSIPGRFIFQWMRLLLFHFSPKCTQCVLCTCSGWAWKLHFIFNRGWYWAWTLNTFFPVRRNSWRADTVADLHVTWAHFFFLSLSVMVSCCCRRIQKTRQIILCENISWMHLFTWLSEGTNKKKDNNNNANTKWRHGLKRTSNNRNRYCYCY